MELKKRITVFIIILILVALVAGTYAFIKNKEKINDNLSRQASIQDEKNSEGRETVELYPEKMEDSTFPNFSDIRKVAYKDDTKWIATNGVAKLEGGKARIYNQKDGLPGSITFDIINHNGTIWVGQAGGVAKFDENAEKFVAYLEGETNTHLFSDNFSNTLYASTFKGFYRYDSENDKWLKDESPFAPVNSTQIVFSEDKIFGTSQQVYPVTVYDKETKTWKKSSLLEYGNQQVLSLSKVGDRVILYGRGANYSGCSEHQKEPASYFMEWKNSTWQSIDNLNKKFFSQEPSIRSIEGNNMTLIYEEDNCDSKTKYKQITVTLTQDSESFGKEIDSELDINFRKDYSEVGNELAQALGYSPYKVIKKIDNNGNIYTKSISKFVNGTSIYGNAGLSILKPSESGYIEKVLLSGDAKNFSYIDPISCSSSEEASLNYVLLRDINEMGGETTDLELYSVDSSYQMTKVDVNIDKFANLNTDGNWICRGSSLYFMDYDGNGYKLNLGNSELTKYNSLTKTQGQPAKISGNDIWFYSPKNKELAKFDTVSERMELSSLGSIANKISEEGGLVAIDDKSRWFVETSEGSDKEKNIYVTDLSGKELGSFSITNFLSSLYLIDDDYAIGKKKDGVFIVDRSDYSLSLLNTDIMPYWGYGQEDTGLGSFDRISFNFLFDKKYNKVWFLDDATTFSIDKDKLVK